MEIYGRSLCVQVTMCHMTERQQLEFKSGLKNFLAHTTFQWARSW